MNATRSHMPDTSASTMGAPALRRFVQAAAVGLLALGAAGCYKESVSDRIDSTSPSDSYPYTYTGTPQDPETPPVEAPVAPVAVTTPEIITSPIEVAENTPVIGPGHEGWDGGTFFDPGPGHDDSDPLHDDTAIANEASAIGPGHEGWDGGTFFDPGAGHEDSAGAADVLIDFDDENDQGDLFHDE